MSITVRLYSKDELEAIKAGTADKHLITIFLNGKNFGEEEIKYYPYGLRRTYLLTFTDLSIVEFYATDDESAWWFAEQEYINDCIESIHQIIINYILVKRPGRIS